MLYEDGTKETEAALLKPVAHIVKIIHLFHLDAHLNMQMAKSRHKVTEHTIK